MNTQVYDNHIRIFCKDRQACADRCDDLVSVLRRVMDFHVNIIGKHDCMQQSCCILV